MTAGSNHRMISTYVNALNDGGLRVEQMREPQPAEEGLGYDRVPVPSRSPARPRTDTASSWLSAWPARTRGSGFIPVTLRRPPTRTHRGGMTGVYGVTLGSSPWGLDQERAMGLTRI